MSQAKLKREIGLTALIFYGLGDILGAGIYALIGKVASEAGRFSWLSFLVAMSVAFLTALSYAELTRRHPKSGGASYFVQVAFKKDSFAFLVGWLLLCVSIVSMATLARAFAGYIEGFQLQVPSLISIAGFLILLTGINLRGIKHSSIANIIGTSVEVLGLIVVIIAGLYFLRSSGSVSSEPLKDVSTMGVLQGATLAFYAFIGFEDLANVAEEVKRPRRNLPIAIVASLAIAGVFYILIGWLSTHVLAPSVLATSPNPMTDIVARSGLFFSLTLFGLVALFAVANTCLLNFITGSRLLYGMARQNLLPDIFERAHEKYHTPIVAILSISPLALLLAALGDLKFLAATTSVLILLVFCATNLSLIKIKNTEKRGKGFAAPSVVPWLAFVTNVILIFYSNPSSLAAAGAMLGSGILVYWALQGIKTRLWKPAKQNQ